MRLFVRGKIVGCKGQLARFHHLQVRADGVRIHCTQSITVRMADRELQWNDAPPDTAMRCAIPGVENFERLTRNKFIVFLPQDRLQQAFGCPATNEPIPAAFLKIERIELGKFCRIEEQLGSLVDVMHGLH